MKWLRDDCIFSSFGVELVPLQLSGITFSTLPSLRGAYKYKFFFLTSKDNLFSPSYATLGLSRLDFSPRTRDAHSLPCTVQYHADFEKNKAKFTQVADDPETQRIKKNTQIISNVAYHGDLAKKEEMERKRLEPADENEERPSWHKAHGEDMAPAYASVHPTKLPPYNDAYRYDTTQGGSKSQAEPVLSYSHSPNPRSQPPQQTYQNDHYPPAHNSSPSKNSHSSSSQTTISSYSTNRPLGHQHPQRYNEHPNPHPSYHTPSGSQTYNTNTQYAPEYIEQSGYYPPNPAGGQNAPNNRYSGKPTNGSSGSYYSTNKHGASHSNYPINSHYATGAPHREDSRRQQEQQQQQQQQQLQQQQQQQQLQQQQLQQQQQQQQQQHQMQQQHHQPIQKHHIPPQQAHHQQYSGPPPSSQHRHPQQSSTTSFLHHQHHPQQPQQYHHHQQQPPPQQPQQQRPKQNPPTSYHHHPTQNLHHDANHNSPYSARTSQTLIYSSQTGPDELQSLYGKGIPGEWLELFWPSGGSKVLAMPTQNHTEQTWYDSRLVKQFDYVEGFMVQQPNRRVGSIADYDPVNEQYGSISQPNAGGFRQDTTFQQRSNLYGDQVPVQQHAPPPQMNSNVSTHKVNAPPTQLGRCYRAMYDYEAADTDEVSFKDGDLIINCTAIDEGWMTGTIQRTGVTGMLPANYVERVS
ncbi:LIM and SH3 domain protein 1 [Halocaridina rubra]|uniref:LIM and SH3 domain protein 1 n=1 Tax=Halocaridina rubra TaxID=373956 RepID=A0AAN8WXW5_HALRR